MNAVLVEVQDVNIVTVLINPAHVVAVVFNRPPGRYPPRWLATIRLSDGSQVIMGDASYEVLRKRLVDVMSREDRAAGDVWERASRG